MMTQVGFLPDETSSFVGRRAELARLETSLATRRMTTLIGPGGVGKTRLAVRAARAAADRYPDGAWWADLSPLYDDALLLPTVSDAVGLADHTLRMPVEALCEWLSDKRLLLVLDSAEHLRGPCSHLLAELITTSPGLTVLVTSRQPLDTRGEHLLRIQPLPVDGAPDALRLFEDRLRAADPHADLEAPGDRAAAADICRRLEGIPLAIELAAAGIGRHTVAQLATRIGTRFDSPVDAEDLTASRLDLLADDSLWPRRHRTLRTTIGWSHELCTPLERLLWARLTVLRTDFDEATAREVCTGGPLTPDAVDRALQGLVAQSVLQWDGTRYRMLDTLREYGRMWLTELGEERAAADRHARSFLGLARRAHDGWTGPDQISWYHRISDTHLDLCAALDHLLVHDVEAAQEMAGRVGFFWACCGHLSEARGYAQRALEAGPVEGAHLTRLQWVQGVAALLQGDFATAEKYGALCTATALYDRDDDGMLGATYLSGLTQLMTGEPAAALEAAERVLRMTEPGRTEGGTGEAPPGASGASGASEGSQGPRQYGVPRGQVSSGGPGPSGDSGGPGEPGPHGEPGPYGVPGEPRPYAVSGEARPSGESYGPGESAHRLRCRLIAVFALTALGRLTESLPAATALRRSCERGGEYWTRSYADYQLALIALLQGRPEDSAAHARDMLVGKHRLRDSFGVALGLDILAAAIAAQGAGAQAARVYGTGHAYWRMVGHPQRGTPELGAVRETCELQARAAVGDEAYQRAFERGQADSAEAGLAAALRSGLQP
ncbi:MULTISPECIES: NB-ARC domain-containing protein [unclassified Streptomyces]|uniref:ATP-binding protein n=1 Tax=unclassified Streptomyces TaxID=2593676 RepID=UPI000823BEDC|nr:MULTISPECIES: NB-ARC domain-containing protein [unclassified Streptomyces]MYU00743.1 regulator [Streptomyces sp. SID8350]SCK10274.1 Predicted ATPase [Streptomyces sp. AmelKG-D3]